jgi:hypothetical protein
MSELSNIVGQATGQKQLIKADQRTADIINQLIKNHHANLPTARKIAGKFKGKTIQQTAENIWNYLKSNIDYKVEPGTKQTTKTIARFLSDAHGDCKHLSNFTGTILSALNIPFAYRFVSFSHSNPDPTHVYVVAYDNGREIPIDAVLPFFNTEKPYTHKIDKKMSLYHLSGIDTISGEQTTELEYIGEVDNTDFYMSGSGKLHVCNNQTSTGSDRIFMPLQYNPIKALSTIGSVETYLGSIGESDFYSIGKPKGKVKQVIKKTGGAAVKVVKKVAKPVAKVVKKVAKPVAKVIKKAPKAAVKAVKKVGLSVPRQAYRGLVALNVRGWATGLQKANAKDPQKVRAQWEKFGGNYGDLMSAVNAGAKKKRIGDVYDSLAGSDTIGFAVPAALTTALPVIAIMVPLIKSIIGSEDGQGNNTTNVEQLPTTVTDNGSTNQDGTTQETTESAGGNNKMLLIGGAALLAFLMFKK